MLTVGPICALNTMPPFSGSVAASGPLYGAAHAFFQTHSEQYVAALLRDAAQLQADNRALGSALEQALDEVRRRYLLCETRADSVICGRMVRSSLRRRRPDGKTSC